MKFLIINWPIILIICLWFRFIINRASFSIWNKQGRQHCINKQSLFCACIQTELHDPYLFLGTNVLILESFDGYGDHTAIPEGTLSLGHGAKLPRACPKKRSNYSQPTCKFLEFRRWIKQSQNKSINSLYLSLNLLTITLNCQNR